MGRLEADHKRTGFAALRLLAAAVCVAFSTSVALAQATPDSENGRFTFSPVPNGVVRLDTRTGQVSTCVNQANGWACLATPDERAAYDEEIGRLQRENEKLKQQLAASGGTANGKTQDALPQDALPKGDSLKPGTPKSAEDERKIEIPLPSDQDVDRAMGFLEKVWRRLIEIVRQTPPPTHGAGKV